MPEWFNVCKSINIIHYPSGMKGKNCMITSSAEAPTSQLGTGETSLKIRTRYDKPTADIKLWKAVLPLPAATRQYTLTTLRIILKYEQVWQERQRNKGTPVRRGICIFRCQLEYPKAVRVELVLQSHRAQIEQKKWCICIHQQWPYQKESNKTPSREATQDYM